MPCVIGKHCEKHGYVHGKEAEELRARFAELAAAGSSDRRASIQEVLDQVDARDSLAFLEARGEGGSHLTADEAYPRCGYCRHNRDGLCTEIVAHVQSDPGRVPLQLAPVPAQLQAEMTLKVRVRSDFGCILWRAR